MKDEESCKEVCPTANTEPLPQAKWISREFLPFMKNASKADLAKVRTLEQEAAAKTERIEEARKRRKKSITLTVGTVELIDAEVERLQRLGIRIAGRNDAIESAFSALVGGRKNLAVNQPKA